MNGLTIGYLLLPNALSLMILIIVFVFVKIRSYSFICGIPAFRYEIVSLGVLLILDACSTLVDKSDIAGGYQLNYAVNFLYFTIQPIVSALWVFFVLDLTKTKLPSWGKIVLSLPFLVTVGLCISSLFNQVLFGIDKDTNTYFRGPAAWLGVALTFIYLGISLFIFFLKRRDLPPSAPWVFSSVAVFPILATIIQMFFSGLKLIYPCATISLLTVFIFIVVQGTDHDSVTGLKNRQQVDEYLQTLTVKRKGKKKYFIGLMLDLNKFKDINDTFGHVEGDAALRSAAMIITRAMSLGSFYARYAGDEFVIFIQTNDLDEKTRVIARIREEEKRFVETSGKEYELHFAIGEVFFETEKLPVSSSSIIELIDQRMYEDKRKA